MRTALMMSAAVAAGILALSTNANGQAFLPAGPITDSTTSLGQFSIVVNPAFSAAVMANYPSNYNSSSNIFTSPLLFDQATTIDRSATTTVGSAAYTSGMPVGSPANGTVKASDISVLPPGYTPPAGEDTVFTQIHSFDLSDGGGFDVKVGAAAAAGTPRSVGEVVSNATGAAVGNPASDFPARSFFDIFVDISIPGLGSDLNNTTPLIINNPAITAFPPVVIYTHGNSSAVPVMLEAGNVFGEPAGTVFGLVTLAGHGAGYSGTPGTGARDENTNQPADSADFESTYMGELSTPADLMPLPNATNTTNGQTTNEESWSTFVPDVPEPTSLSLLVAGAAAVALRRRNATGSAKA